MKEIKTGIIIVGTFIIFMIIFFIYIQNQWDKQLEEIDTEYPSPTNLSSLKGKVAGFYDPEGLRDSPYCAFITLRNGKKIRLYVNMRVNRLPNLMDILEIGDSIVKKAGTDSLYIIKTVNGVSRRHGFTLFNEEIK